MIIKVGIGHFRITSIKQQGAMYQITFEILSAFQTLHVSSTLQFKPKLKVGDFIDLYTEIEHDAKPQ